MADFCKPRKDIKNHGTLNEIHVSGATESIINPETLVQEHAFISLLSYVHCLPWNIVIFESDLGTDF